VYCRRENLKQDVKERTDEYFIAGLMRGVDFVMEQLLIQSILWCHDSLSRICSSMELKMNSQVMVLVINISFIFILNYSLKEVNGIESSKLNVMKSTIFIV
jgi:hypothetical protein